MCVRGARARIGFGQFAYIIHVCIQPIDYLISILIIASIQWKRWELFEDTNEMEMKEWKAPGIMMEPDSSILGSHETSRELKTANPYAARL